MKQEEFENLWQHLIIQKVMILTQCSCRELLMLLACTFLARFRPLFFICVIARFRILLTHTHRKNFKTFHLSSEQVNFMKIKVQIPSWVLVTKNGIQSISDQYPFLYPLKTLRNLSYVQQETIVSQSTIKIDLLKVVIKDLIRLSVDVCRAISIQICVYSFYFLYYSRLEGVRRGKT